MTFRRTISTALETALGPGGPLNWLVARVSAPDSGLDLHLRSSGGSTSWVSLYAGMTSVLDVYDNAGGLSLRVHPTHRAAGAFDDLWSARQSPANLGDQHVSVDAYLDRILADGAISPRWTSREGRVQSAISRVVTEDFGCFQREAVPAFESDPIKCDVVAPLFDRMWGAMCERAEPPPWWPGVRDHGQRPRPGLEADLLGLDPGGRLLVIEVKPADEVKGIAWAPGQARLYAELFALVFEIDPAARDSMAGVQQQHRTIRCSGTMARQLQPPTAPQRARRPPTDQPTVTNLTAGYSWRRT